MLERVKCPPDKCETNQIYVCLVKRYGEHGHSYRCCEWRYLGNGVAENNFGDRETDWLYLERYETFEEEAARLQASFNLDDSLTNVLGLYTDLYFCEGEHEYDNSWTSYDAYELMENLKDRSFFIVGVCYNPPYGCVAFSPAETAAFVIQDDLTGDRYWVHTKKSWVIKMRNQLADYYNSILYIKEPYEIQEIDDD